MSMNIANNSRHSRANANLRCFACLSVDRNLKPLKEMSLMAMVCPEIYLNATITTHYLICFECQAMIFKIKEFKARVVKAQSILKITEKSGRIITQGLSNLKRTQIELVVISSNGAVATTVNNEIEPENIKTEEITVEVKKEKCDDPIATHYQDYDELIGQTSIHQLSKLSSGESTDSANETETDCDPCSSMMIQYPLGNQVKRKNVETEVAFNTPVKKLKDPLQPPNFKINIKFPKPVTNTQRETFTPRGTKEHVKVTGGIPNTSVLKNNVSNTDMSNEGLSNKVVSKNNVSNTNVSKVVDSNASVSKIVDPNLAQDYNKEMLFGLYGFDDIEVKCKLLNTSEMNLFREGKRNQTIFKNSRYKCVTCLDRFINQANLDAHNKKHEVESGKFICELCEQRFPESSMRDSHYKAHFIIYECISCAWQSNDRFLISEHIRKTHQISEFNCKQCGAVFQTFKELRKHRLKEHFSKPSCEECGRKFSSHNALLNHMALHTGETVECTLCKEKLNRSRLRAHMNSHHKKEEDAVYCATCGTYYKSKATYAAHLKFSLKHNPIETLGLKCDHCGRSFGTKSSLIDHIQSEHTLNSEVVCNICKKVCKSKTRLVRHMRVTHAKNKHRIMRVCEICGKSYSSKPSLDHHMNTHLGLRPFKCQDCGDTFSYSASLYTHRKLVHKVKKKCEREKEEREKTEKTEKEDRDKEEIK